MQPNQPVFHMVNCRLSNEKETVDIVFYKHDHYAKDIALKIQKCPLQWLWQFVHNYLRWDKSTMDRIFT